MSQDPPPDVAWSLAHIAEQLERIADALTGRAAAQAADAIDAAMTGRDE